MKIRFFESPNHVTGLLNLVPSQCCTRDVESEIPQDLLQAVEFYQADLPHAGMFPTEYRKWVRTWRQDYVDAPDDLGDSLKACDRADYPNLIKILLHTALTIPVTSCDSERSFS